MFSRTGVLDQERLFVSVFAGYPDPMASPPPAHRELRSVLMWILDTVRTGAVDESVKVPPALRRQAAKRDLPAAALGPLRRAIESDDELRGALAEHLERDDASAGDVDRIGRLWLLRPPDWRAQIDDLTALAGLRAELDALRSELNGSERRRIAAEDRAEREKTQRRKAEQSARSTSTSTRDAQRDLERAQQRAEAVSAEVSQLKMELRHTTDRLRAAEARTIAERDQVDELRAEIQRLQSMRDDLMADRATSVIERTELHEVAAVAEELARRLRVVVDPAPTPEIVAPPEQSARRRALALPGGVVSDSVAAVAHLLRSGAVVLVDGYNVSMTAWPDQRIDRQRERLIELLETAARRFGADITVVFDGADVLGAAQRGRRLIRVVFSPEGVTADDVIRDEVRAVGAHRPVVVITSDAAVVRSTRSMGANTARSDRFLETIR
jgi:predicted RNA-binding protein with PIN domain